MRVSYDKVVFLACLCAVAFSADLHAATMPPGQPIAAVNSNSDGHADTSQTSSILDQAATWVLEKQRESS